MGKVDTNVNTEAVAVPKKQSRFLRELLKNYPLFLMVLPGVILVSTFSYAPMVGLVMAFKNYNLRGGMFGSPWCGLDNFKFLFAEKAGELIRNTLCYNAIFIIFGMIFAVTLAIALSELRGTKMKKIYQTIIIMPHFLSIVIVSYLVYAFLNPVSGTVNNTILPALGIFPKNGDVVAAWAMWYDIPKIWPYVLVFVHFWKGVGYSSIVYVASIAGIDQEMYEAAVIDGATKWQQIRKITIPMLVPLMIILGTLNVGKIFNADFGLFYQVPRNRTAEMLKVTEVIDTYVYSIKTQGLSRTGEATAAGFFQSMCSFVLVLTTNAIVKKIDPERSLF